MTMTKVIRAGVTLAFVGAALAGCAAPGANPAAVAPSQPIAPEQTTADPATPAETRIEATITSVTDGDTIVTDLGTVRIIGIDTAERGECGYDEGAGLLSLLLPQGSTVILTLPDQQHDRDRYDRLLRYVTNPDGVDVGLAQIEAGLAVARYDSRDGYPKHPREDAYRAAQLASLSEDRRVITPECGAAAAELAAAQAEQNAALDTPGSAPTDGWWTQYRSCSHLRKNTVGHPTGPFDVNNPAETEIYNWFQYGTGFSGDGDGDGLACE